MNQDIALVTAEKELSYGALFDLSESIGAHVAPRSLVLFVGTNCVDSVAGYVGFLNKRAVPLMVPDKITPEAFQNLVAHYDPEYLWIPKSSITVSREVIEKHHVCIKSFGEYLLFGSRIEKQQKEFYPQLALLLSTSGSTGSPKYVRLSYKNLESNAVSIAEYMSLATDDRAITTLPFSYSYGLSIINSHLMAGSSIVLTDQPLLSREFWDIVGEKKITNFGGVPYTYTMLQRLRFGRKEIKSLRFITQAGGRLGSELQQEFATIAKERNLDFYVMYGQTEATARMSYLDPSQTLSKLGCIGKAIPGGHFELIDEAGKPVLAPFTSGELVYYGSNVSLGYALDRNDLSLGDERLGVLETGDVACRDEEGFYSIVGRKKRFLKVYGNRVNLDELEAMMTAQGFTVACSGADDLVKIYTESNPKQVTEVVCASTGLYKGAFSVVYVDEIPRNQAGKILYSVLEQ